ncbi:hypothetical protein G6F63_016522 [Rhizopus arrhizus]|nr:hypothetical protein G6F63_016522 [Rhizopus arrhizus]
MKYVSNTARRNTLAVALISALLAAAPFSASADALSYTYVEGGWTQVKVDDNALDDPKVDGAYLRGSPTTTTTVR